MPAISAVSFQRRESFAWSVLVTRRSTEPGDKLAVVWREDKGVRLPKEAEAERAEIVRRLGVDPERVSVAWQTPNSKERSIEWMVIVVDASPER
jgi:hypothetical protein